MSHSNAGVTVPSSAYSSWTSLITDLIRFTYSISVRKDVFNFTKPGPLWFAWSDRSRVITEWSVLYPGQISASVILPNILWLTKKKSSPHWTIGRRCLQVYLLSSGLKILQTSTRSKFSFISRIVLRLFWWVLVHYKVEITAYDNVFAFEIYKVG